MENRPKEKKEEKPLVSDDRSISNHGGHQIRTGRKVVDRSRVGEDNATPAASSSVKQPNQYNGHTFKNTGERFRLDGHKMLHHLDRVVAWQRGERIAPIHIDMGLTKFCNVGCIYCIGVTQIMRKGKMIEPEPLLRFIKDCSRLGVRSVAFIGDGEPTLNPAMTDAAVEAKKGGVDIGIATNGVVLDMSRAHDLLQSTTFIRFNLSAAEGKAFLRIHQSHEENLQVIVENIRELVRLKKKHGYNCTIGIQMVLIPENFDQIMKLGELGASLGVDYLQIKQCSDTEYKEIGINHADYRQVVDVLKEVEKLSTPEYHVKVKWNKINILDETEVYLKGFRKYDICYGTPFLGQISGDGRVFPCGPYFGKMRFFMGDIHEQSYYDIVKSDRYWEVQKDIVNNIDVHCDCTVGCRQDYINKFLWDLKNPPEHVNFI